MIIPIIINLVYIISAILFVFGLKMLTSQATARKGNLLSALGMFLAVVMTLLSQGIIERRYSTSTPASRRFLTRLSTDKTFAIPSLALVVINVGGKSSEKLDWPV